MVADRCRIRGEKVRTVASGFCQGSDIGRQSFRPEKNLSKKIRVRARRKERSRGTPMKRKKKKKKKKRIGPGKESAIARAPQHSGHGFMATKRNSEP